jgi:hypothetical protein
MANNVQRCDPCLKDPKAEAKSLWDIGDIVKLIEEWEELPREGA